MLRVLSVFKQDPVAVVPTFLFRLPLRSRGEPSFHQAANWVLADLLPRIWKRGVAQFADVAWDSDPESYQYFDRYLQVARSLGIPCKIHADHLSPLKALAMAVEHAVVSIDHLEHATGEEAAILGPTDVIATLLPCASFRDGRHAPARALVDSGTAIALGTNFNPHHTPTLSMQAAVALASRRIGLTVAEALSAATINGAHALGCADRVGSLEPGKSADVLVLNVTDYRDLADTFGTNVVHMTVKRGAVIYREGTVAPRSPG
jgi:imidazolonepropionase